jgi:vanillate/4-hydroxybenzoate decarboxylase subunit D
VVYVVLPAYPDSFKMTIDEIVNAPEVPAIPPLLTKRGL